MSGAVSRRDSPSACIAPQQPDRRPHPARDVLESPIAALGVVTMAALAPLLGKDTARAVRDWCQRHEVPYRRDGKHNWVSVADVRAAIARLPLRPAAIGRERESAGADAVAQLIGRR